MKARPSDNLLRRDAAAGVLLLALLALTAWLYWPGTSGPALLDDVSSVLVIDNLQNNPERAMDAILGDDSGPLGRVLSMATFVAEKLWLGDSLTISKRVNLALHLGNGLLVFLVLRLLLGHVRAPAAPVLAALLAGGWLLAPLQVSSVLYVVQRMAMLATTCMLLALLAWILWRQSLARGRPRHVWLLLAVLATLAGPFAKENAVVVIPVLLVLEALWFECRDAAGRVMPRLRNAVWGSIGLGALGLVAVALLRWESLAARFDHRPFTLEERLLTQLRILWDYLGQLWWPDVQRLGIYHDDIAISTSFTEPLSTLWAALAWGGLLLLAGLAAWRWTSGRCFLAGLAWYLLGHAVESSVLPLELYFEHRNYFPAVGLWLILGLLLAQAMRLGRPLVLPLLVYLGVWVGWLALQTSPLVQLWSSRPLLTLHQLNGHPASPRANTDMAVLLADAGAYSEARHYSEQAFAHSRGERVADLALRNIALGCMAGSAIPAEEIERIGRHNPQRPVSSVTTLLTLVRMLQDDRCPGLDRVRFADHMATLFLVEDFRRRAAPNIYFSLAVLENALQRFDMAYRYADQYLAMLPDDTRGQLMQLHFTTALGKVAEAEALKTRLLEKQAAGELSVGDGQTLALYLEPEQD